MTIASLRADAANLKSQNRRLREQLNAMQQGLSETLGRQIDTELDPAGYQPPQELRSQLEAGHGRVFELEEQLADAREELEAVHEINRELLNARNRSA